MDDRDNGQLRGDVERDFLDALERLQAGERHEAKALLKGVLQSEPRLAEPYLELAVIAHAEGDLDEAVIAARIGLELVETTGPWTRDLSPEALLSHARNLLGELLVEVAQQGDIPLDRARFAPLWNEAAALFEAAAQADPTNQRARANQRRVRPVPEPER